MIKRFADRLFKWYCNPEYYPDIKGDLEELYADHLETNARVAAFKYVLDVLLLFRISLIKPIKQNSIIKDTGMFKNYFKISIRTLVRHKLFTAINVIGLAVGLASFLLIYEYVKFEQSYDSFHPKADQLYRVSYVRVENDEIIDKDAMSAYSVGKVLEENVPEIELHTVSKQFDELLVRNGETFFRERSVITADPTFLDLFDFRVLEGSKSTMLNEPNSVVLTQSRAKAYFGIADPIGKTLEVTGDLNARLKVTGVIMDVPDNTHYRFDMMVSDATLKGSFDYENWQYNNYYVYIRIAQGINIDSVSAKANEAAYTFMNGENRNLASYNQLDIHPVQDIHLTSDFTYEPQLHGSKRAVDFLLIVSIFILVIAWVNYVNLSTARAVDRAKEVGVRKVIGAVKKQLIFQFLCEALIVNVISAAIALLLAESLLPFFNDLVGKEIHQHVWNIPSFIVSLSAFTVLGALGSGFYPAIILSNFKPIEVLKGKLQSTKSGVVLRKILVVVQFAASMVLIASTMIIYRQVSYMQGKDIGISLDYVVNVYVPDDGIEEEDQQAAFDAKLRSFKDVLRTHSAIEAVGGASNLPGGEAADINSTSTRISLAGLTEPTRMLTYVQYNDEGFMDVVNMQLIAGRNFDATMVSDSNAFIANESFMRRFKQPNIESLVGNKLEMGGKTFHIIGIVKDFNRTSLKTQIEPTLYAPWMEANNVVVKLSASSYQEGLKHLEATWEDYYPNAPFDYVFLDERFAQLYDQDRKFGDTFLFFASLAILIAILGLYGLASFLSIQRSKEVGVRKVLGASIVQIIYLFYKDFFALIGFAAIISIPAIYYFMNQWLNGYAFRIDFPWYLMVLALMVVLLFALVTVAYQIRKVASLNPARTLQYE